MSVFMFLRVSQMAGMIRTKLGAQTHLDLGSVLDKSKSRCEHHRHVNGDAICGIEAGQKTSRSERHRRENVGACCAIGTD